MPIRTDLAMENRELAPQDLKGIEETTQNYEKMTVYKLKIKNKAAAREIGRQQGIYVTARFDSLTQDFTAADSRIKAVADEISAMLPPRGLIMVVGLGNTDITPDALGPKSASLVLATRHICDETAKTLGLEKLRPVAVISPGVMGKTGVESGEIISAAAAKIKPAAIVAIDALASRRAQRLGCTLQISDTGILPGAGVSNRRGAVTKETMGVPVISVGVPTVVYASTLAADMMENMGNILPPDFFGGNDDMVVTPREIDVLIKRAAGLISMALNMALQPSFELEDILSLVG